MINKSADNISEQTLASTLNDTVRTAVQQRTTMGLAAQSPFLLLAREVQEASEEMREFGMALTPG